MSKIYTKRLDGTTAPAKPVDPAPNLRRERETPRLSDRPSPADAYPAQDPGIDDPFSGVARVSVPVEVSYKHRKTAEKPEDAS